MTDREAFVYGLISGIIYKDEFKNLKVENFDPDDGLQISYGDRQYQVVVHEISEEDVPLAGT